MRDIQEHLADLLSQVPRGRVTTYGDLAAALGDPVAARAVGTMLSEGGLPANVPAHRVVLADGRIAGDPDVTRASARLLAREGVRVEAGRVADLGPVLFTGFRSGRPLARLRREQERLRERWHPGPLPHRVDRLIGVDVAYTRGREAYAAAVELEMGSFEPVSQRVVKVDVDFPYIPTYLGFRELPAVRAALGGWDLSGALVLIDGQGTIHPRRFGIACQAGVALGVPTVGVAKGLLWGSYDRAQLRREGVARVLGDGEHVGWAISPPSGAPVFASPGHMVGLEDALQLTLGSMGRRQPVPLELAHRLANAKKRAARG